MPQSKGSLSRRPPAGGVCSRPGRRAHVPSRQQGRFRAVSGSCFWSKCTSRRFPCDDALKGVRRDPGDTQELPPCAPVTLSWGLHRTPAGAAQGLGPEPLLWVSSDSLHKMKYLLRPATFSAPEGRREAPRGARGVSQTDRRRRPSPQLVNVKPPFGRAGADTLL